MVTAAGHRCQCAGTCGKKHADHHGRCPAGTTRPVPLYVAPTHPTVGERDHRTPLEELAAWCAACLDGTRGHSRTAPEVTSDQPDLLDLLGFEIPSARAKNNP